METKTKMNSSRNSSRRTFYTMASVLSLLRCVVILAATGAAYVTPPTKVCRRTILSTVGRERRRQRPFATTTSSSPLFSSAVAPSDDHAAISSPPRRQNPLFGRLFHRKPKSSTRRTNITNKHPSKQQPPQPPPPFLIPSLFNSIDSRPIVLFDGKCNLCNAGVQLILDYDRADTDARGNLRVAAMQSQVGQLLLSRLTEKERNIVLGKNNNKTRRRNTSDVDEDNDDDEEEVEYKSIVVISPTTTHLNSNACLRIGRELSGPLRTASYIAGVVPNFIRDRVYKLLSKNRKRLFGTSTECRLWDDNWDTRFVDDGVITGEQQPVLDTDPFADPNAIAARSEDNGRTNARAALVQPGDTVRVVVAGDDSSTSPPAVHTHISGYSNGICTVGSVGTVTRVLNERAYPKNVAVKFELDVGGYIKRDIMAAAAVGDNNTEEDRKGTTTTCSFEAHFFPGQLRKE